LGDFLGRIIAIPAPPECSARRTIQVNVN